MYYYVYYSMPSINVYKYTIMCTTHMPSINAYKCTIICLVLIYYYVYYSYA